jgi:hypothetical protein
MTTSQFILLPERGDAHSEAGQMAAAALGRVPPVKSTQPPAMSSVGALGEVGIPDQPMLVIDSIAESGPKLVELGVAAAASITASAVPLRAVPVVTYALPVYAAAPLKGLAASAPTIAGFAPRTVTVRCLDADTGAPLVGCQVAAFTDFGLKVGAGGLSNQDGEVRLTLYEDVIERLYVVTEASHWGAFRRQVSITNGEMLAIPVAPVRLAQPDALRMFYAQTRFEAAVGVRVGVIDSGVDAHPELNLIRQENTVTGELKNDVDDWLGHGTHVAGLIGARGLPGGLRGMAPGAELYGYRVFGRNSEGATNYAILKAMMRAAADGCDIINLSLGGGDPETIVMEAVQDACNQGMLVTVAAGNDGRAPVANPAAYNGATAVSAVGLTTGFPSGSLSEADIEHPPTSAAYPDEFVAGFSNIGPQVAVAAPGVGVLSTLPNGLYGPMSGTSMAAPVAAGAAACLLSRDQPVYDMDRDAARAAQIRLLLLKACSRRGFPPAFVGSGVPDPAQI